jgi:hypothetical protein
MVFAHQYERVPKQHEPPVPAAGRRVSSSVQALVDRVGNRGLSALRGRLIQRKAEATGVSVPEDPLELLADRAADLVVAEPAADVGPAPPPAGEPSSGATMQRDPLPGADRAPSASVPSTPGPPAAARAPRPGGGPSPHGVMASELLSALDAGAPLPSDVRRFMERRFGTSFADVRVHTGDRAADAAASVSAKAFTIGSEIVFGAGRWEPESHEGRRLLAHELAHVVQQGADMGAPAPTSVTEADADRAGHDVAEGRIADVSARAVPGALQREPVWATDRTTVVTSVTTSTSDEGETVWTIFAAHGEGVVVADVITDSPNVGSLIVNAYEYAETEPGVLYLSIHVGDKSARINRRQKAGRWHEIRRPGEGPPFPRPQEPKPPPQPKPKAKPKRPAPGAAPLPRLEPFPLEPERRPEDVAEPSFTPAPRSPAQASSDRVAALTDNELGAMGVNERRILLEALASSGGALDVTAVRRILDATPDEELTPLLDSLFADRGRLLRGFAESVMHGDDARQLAGALERVWNRSQALPDDGRPRWRVGLLGEPVKLDRQQYDRMLALAPRALALEVERMNERIAWEDRSRSWRMHGLGLLMGPFVESWSGVSRPPTALETLGDPRYFWRSPYHGLFSARRKLQAGDYFGAGEALSQASLQSEALLAEWTLYRDLTELGGKAAIKDLERIQAGSDVALILLSLGQGAVVIGTLRGATLATGRVLAWQSVKGAGFAGGFGAARQGVEILQGTRTEFSPGELAGTMATGALLGPVVMRNPNLMIPLSAAGVRSGIHEFSEGNLGTAAFDVTVSVLPYGGKLVDPYVGAFGPWLRPRVAAIRILTATMRGAGEVEGIGPAPYARASTWQFNQPALQATQTTISPSTPGVAWSTTVPPRPSWAPVEVSPNPASPGPAWATVPKPGSTPLGWAGFGNAPIVVQIVVPSQAAPPISTSRPRTGAEGRFMTGSFNSIRANPNHRLRFLLNEDQTGFQRPPSRAHSELISVGEDVWYVEMGHMESHWSGGPERLALEDAWINQIDRVTAEGGRRAWIHKEAIDIDGVAVEKQTALLWESHGKLPAGTVANARPSSGQTGAGGTLIDWSPE